MTSPRTSSIPEEHGTLATNYDMYDRIAKTLEQPDINSLTIRAITLQLAGAPSRPQELGEDIRGDIHLAIVSGTSANLSRFLSAVTDLAPVETTHMNGTNTTLAGAVGSTSGNSLTPGPLLDDSIDLTVIEQFDETGGKTHEAFQQILDASTYSFTKANYRETISATGSILIAANPKYGNFDQYEPIAQQLNLSPEIHASVDLTLLNFPNDATPVHTEEDALPPDLARQYITSARSIDPTLTTAATTEISTYLDTLESAFEDDDPTPIGINRLRETLARFALAHARLQLSNEATESDAKRIISLVETAHQQLGIEPERGQFDADVVETGTTSQRDNNTNILHIVDDLEDEYNRGAPKAEVIDRAMDLGFDRSAAEHELEKLLQKAEIYEPAENTLRTT